MKASDYHGRVAYRDPLWDQHSDRPDPVLVLARLQRFFSNVLDLSAEECGPSMPARESGMCSLHCGIRGSLGWDPKQREAYFVIPNVLACPWYGPKLLGFSW